MWCGFHTATREANEGRDDGVVVRRSSSHPSHGAKADGCQCQSSYPRPPVHCQISRVPRVVVSANLLRKLSTSPSFAQRGNRVDRSPPAERLLNGEKRRSTSVSVYGTRGRETRKMSAWRAALLGSRSDVVIRAHSPSFVHELTSPVTAMR